MLSIISTLSALAALPLALSAPLSSRQTTGGGSFNIVALSSAEFLNNVPLAASGGAFYLGVPTNAQCPPSASDCSQYSNTTSIIVDSLSSEAGMYSTTPQRVYVAQNGVFSYLEPNAGTGPFPDGSYQTPFNGAGDRLTFTGGNSNGWIACPLFTPGALPYQVLAKVSSMGAVCADAIDIEIQTSYATQLGAYDYE